MVANAVTLLAANFVGLYHKTMHARAHKQMFVDTRNCIESRVKLEHERQQQVKFGGVWEGVGLKIISKCRHVDLQFGLMDIVCIACYMTS